MGAAFTLSKNRVPKMKLTDTVCKTSKPEEKAYKLVNDGSIYLKFMPHGSKLWRFRYKFAGKENPALLAL